MTIAPPYQNSGNDLVLSLVPATVRSVLDVGCGTGDNARRLKEDRTGVEVVGLTHNATEAQMAARFMSAVHVRDVEHDPLDDLGGPFDLLLFSHVLEHLRDPVSVLRRFLPMLAIGGHVLIAVPNTLEWRTRVAFLRGRFQYAEHGILDRTHLRFFTFNSATAELIAPISSLVLVRKEGRGAAPLGPLRRHLLPRGLRARLDDLAVWSFPNVFAGEVALLASKTLDPKFS